MVKYPGCLKLQLGALKIHFRSPCGALPEVSQLGPCMYVCVYIQCLPGKERDRAHTPSRFLIAIEERCQSRERYWLTAEAFKVGLMCFVLGTSHLHSLSPSHTQSSPYDNLRLEKTPCNRKSSAILRWVTGNPRLSWTIFYNLLLSYERFQSQAGFCACTKSCQRLNRSITISSCLKLSLINRTLSQDYCLQVFNNLKPNYSMIVFNP